jgi:phage gpG-like protein
MLDLTKVYEKIAHSIAADLQMYIGLNMVKTNFDFSKLKSTAEKKNPNTGKGTLRIQSGNLFRSFSPKRKDSGNILDIKTTKEGLTMRYGSSIVYAAIHEFGGKAGKNGSAVIPARPYFGPAIEEWKKERMNETISEAKQEIIEGVRKWLASQKQSKK